MSKYISKLGPMIEAMLDYREALGFSRNTHMSSFMSFDRYCAEYDPDAVSLSKRTVLAWIYREMEKPRVNIEEKATAMRLLGKYMAAVGKRAYELPNDFVSRKKVFTPYVFTDSELANLFCAVDSLPAGSTDNIEIIAPVLFRMIYTCGLRPSEGRLLEHSNVNLETGEIFITKTKRKKERFVVMSCDMHSLCRAYDRYRQELAGDSIYMFPRPDGNAYSEHRLDRVLKRCWEMANPDVGAKILPKIRIYDLRHQYASATLNRWLDAKRDLYVMLPYLRAYMGHTHFSETAYYIHLLPENLVKSAGIDWAAFDALIPEVTAWQE